MDTYAWTSPTAGAVTVTQADSFVVVSWWRDKTCHVPPYKGSYCYEVCETQNAANDLYSEYERGEYAGVSAIGIFAAKGGMPVGGRVL